MLLLCAKRTFVVNSEDTYKVKIKFKLDAMQVIEGATFDVDNTFFIRDDIREVQLYAEYVQK